MSSVTEPLFLVLAAAVALCVRRLARRGSHSRLWFRLWLYTWRERVRSFERARREARRAADLAAHRAAPMPPLRGPRHDAPVALPRAARSAHPANDGVWIGNVFRPHAFQPSSAARRLRSSR